MNSSFITVGTGRALTAAFKHSSIQAFIRHLVILLLLFVAMPAVAQQRDERHPGKKRHADITELVSDLSAPQKRKIEAVSKESKERVDALRVSQRAVRDSIRMYMDLEGDQSRYLHPLFDREAQLQAAVNREMYSAKLRIDKILTPDQRAALRKSKD